MGVRNRVKSYKTAHLKHYYKTKDLAKAGPSGHSSNPSLAPMHGYRMCIYLVCVNLLNEPFQCGHPTGGEMTVLEEYPSTTIHGLFHHCLCSGALPLAQRDCRQLLLELHLKRVEDNCLLATLNIPPIVGALYSGHPWGMTKCPD